MAFNGSLSYPDGGHGRRAGGLRESWPLLRRPPSFLPFIGILLRRSALPQTIAVRVCPSVAPSIPGSRVPDFRRRTKLSGKASKHGIPRQVPIQDCLYFN